MDFNRDSFVFHKDWYNALTQLDNDLRLELYDAIMRKAFYNEPPVLSHIGQMAMSFIEPQIERDFDKWLDIRDKRKQSGQKGGLAKQANASKCYQMLASASKCKQMLHNNINNNNDNNDNNINNDIIEEKDSKEKEVSEFVDKIYAMYPTKCPVRGTSTGKSHKDKDRIRRLLKKYSREDIEKVVKHEVEENLGKTMMKNFSTFLNNLPDPSSLSSGNVGSSIAYPTSVDDVKGEDIPRDYNSYLFWVEKKCVRLIDDIGCGFPDNEQQFDSMVKHTKGGLRALAYVYLVLNRDGWDAYKDQKGFMWIYYKFINANGLYEG